MHFLAGFAAAALALFGATFSLAQGVIASHSATILFGGDMMFDRSVRVAIDKNGGDFIFSCIDDTLEKADLVVANLEGPITASDSESVGSAVGSPSNFVFTFPLSTAILLQQHHIDVVNLGNNHIMNFGTQGVRSTMALLDAVKIDHFGDPLTFGTAERDVNGIPFVFINYNEFGGSSAITLKEIKAAVAAGKMPIVYTHWGIEYATTSPQSVKNLAHAFVDAGAKAVIGSHPHVVEDHETYKGVPIYYSLGNFIFDQYWSDDVDHGLLLSLAFNEDGVRSVQEIPIELLHDRRTCPVQ